MQKATRREALKFVAVSTGSIALGSGAVRAQSCDEERVSDDPGAQTWAEEREKVVSLGFTEDEAECWELIARAAGKFFELPELHPSDAPEVAEAVHIIQNKLMSRPTYRRYRQPTSP